jgi:hypothetical protein
MSGLNTQYIPLSTIQELFWDKLLDAPLAAGIVSFYSDIARTVPKNVYTLTGTPPSYTYASLGAVLTLSSIGTFDDGAGNNIVPYLYPYDLSGNVELYYITVYNSVGQFQFSVGGVPNVAATITPSTIPQERNFIENGQFVLNQNAGVVSNTVTTIAYGGWRYLRSSNLATDAIAFPRFNAPLITTANPTGNPRYACQISCSVPNLGDTYKTLEVRFEDVNRFSSSSQTLTLFFSGINNLTGTVPIPVSLYKNFGAGGSAPTTTPIGTLTINASAYSNANYSFSFGDNFTKTLGTGNDDYFSIQLSLPASVVFDISLTDFALFLGTEVVTSYPFSLDPMQYASPYSQTFVTILALNVYTTNWQTITGTAITIPPGVYSISYNINLQITSFAGTGAFIPIATLYSSAAGTQLTNSRSYGSGGTPNKTITGSAGATIIYNTAVPTTISIQAAIDSLVDLVTFTAYHAQLIINRLGRME